MNLFAWGKQARLTTLQSFSVPPSASLKREGEPRWWPWLCAYFLFLQEQIRDIINLPMTGPPFGTSFPKKPLTVSRLLARATGNVAGSYFLGSFCRRPPATMLRRERTVTLVSPSSHPPSASLKRKGSGPVIRDPSIALGLPMDRGTPTGPPPTITLMYPRVAGGNGLCVYYYST